VELDAFYMCLASIILYTEGLTAVGLLKYLIPFVNTQLNLLLALAVVLSFIMSFIFQLKKS